MRATIIKISVGIFLLIEAESLDQALNLSAQKLRTISYANQELKSASQ